MQTDLCSLTLRRFVPAAILCALACTGAGDRISGSSDIYSISISPTSLTLDRGRVRVLRVQAFSATGAELSSRNVTWTVTDSNIAHIEPGGLLRAWRSGSTEVRAHVGARVATMPVTVTDSSTTIVAKLELSAVRDFVWLLDTLALSARVLNAFDEDIPDSVVRWTSSAPSVAEVSGTGVVRGLALGSSTITATAGTIPREMIVNVEAMPALRVSGPGRMMPRSQSVFTLGALRRGAVYGTSAAWTSSDPTIASVSADGLVSALRAGTTTITAVRNALSYSAELTVGSLDGRITFLEDGWLHLLPLDESLAEMVPSVNGAPLRTSSAAASPNGLEIAYDCYSGVCIAPLAGGTSRLAVAGASSPSWTADGRKLVVRSDWAEITTADLVTGKLERMRTSHYVFGPRVSPSGEEVAFLCDFSDPYGELGDICLSTIPTYGLAAVISQASAVSWSPDGTRLAFVHYGLCTSLRSDPSRCTTAMAFAPGGTQLETAWSPGGTHLVVAREDGLWIVEPDGSNPVRVRVPSTTGAPIRSPSWTR